MPLPFCRRGAFDLTAYLNDITHGETHFQSLHIGNHSEDKLLLFFGQRGPFVQNVPLFCCQRDKIALGKELAQRHAQRLANRLQR